MVESSFFTSNTVVGGYQISLSGGALEIDQQWQILVRGSNFTSNTVTFDSLQGEQHGVSGGALAVTVGLLNRTIDSVEITGCTFSSNAISSQAEAYGGAVGLQCATCWRVVNITGNNFTDNMANSTSSYGGAFMLEGDAFMLGGGAFGTAFLSNNRFVGNRALSPGNGGGGGAVAFSDSGGTLVSKGNTYQGGVKTFVSKSHPSFQHADNRASCVDGGDQVAGESAGGGLFRWCTACTIELDGDIFQNNVATGGSGTAAGALTKEVNAGTGYGGGFATRLYYGGTVHVSNCTFRSNQAIGGDAKASDGRVGISGGDAGDAWGGAMFVEGGSGSVFVDRWSSFHANRAQGGHPGSASAPFLAGAGKAPTVAGGAISLTRDLALDVASTTFSSNVAQCLQPDGSIIPNSEGFGGAISLQGPLTIKRDTTFINNSVRSHKSLGGAIFNAFSSSAWHSTLFRNNHALGSWTAGGAIALVNGPGQMTSCQVDDNFVDVGNSSHGGGLYLDSSPVMLNGTNITNNQASFGGGVFIEKLSEAYRFGPGTLFVHNRGHIGGGGVFTVFDLRSTTQPPAENICCGDTPSCVKENFAPYGSECGANGKLLLGQSGHALLPTWPGQMFGVDLAVIDFYGNEVIRNDTLLRVSSPSGTPGVHFDPGAPLSEVGVLADGTYSFRGMSVRGVLGSGLPLLFETEPPLADAAVLNLTVRALLMPCPPSFAFSDATQTCEPCHETEYLFTGGGDTCAVRKGEVFPMN